MFVSRCESAASLLRYLHEGLTLMSYQCYSVTVDQIIFRAELYFAEIGFSNSNWQTQTFLQSYI